MLRDCYESVTLGNIAADWIGEGPRVAPPHALEQARDKGGSHVCRRTQDPSRRDCSPMTGRDISGTSPTHVAQSRTKPSPPAATPPSRSELIVDRGDRGVARTARPRARQRRMACDARPCGVSLTSAYRVRPGPRRHATRWCDTYLRRGARTATTAAPPSCASTPRPTAPWCASIRRRSPRRGGMVLVSATLQLYVNSANQWGTGRDVNAHG